MDRFWNKVSRTEHCWIWTAYKNSLGYGVFRFNKTTQLSHRVSWMLSIGPIPEGLLVCHHCDNPSCVNPAHLFLGTNRDNVADRESKGRNKIPRCTGEDHGLVKLTREQVAEIKKFLKAGEQSKIIADSFGVSPTTIYRIKSGQTWSQVKESN